MSARMTGVMAILLILILPPALQAQEATLVRSAAQKIFEFIGQRFGRSAVDDLTDLGGREFVEQLTERADATGGEKLVQRVVYYGEKDGPEALRAMKEGPEVIVPALDKIPSGEIKEAVGAINRDPKQMYAAIKACGPDALRAEIKNPGVGLRFDEALGKPGALLCEKLDQDQAIATAQHLGAIERLPATQRTKLLDALTEYPGRAGDFFEHHPRVMITTAGVPLLIYAIHAGTTPTIGKDANGNQVILEPSLVGQAGHALMGLVRSPLQIAICTALAILLFGILLFLGPRAYRWRQMKRSITSSTSTRQSTPRRRNA